MLVLDEPNLRHIMVVQGRLATRHSPLFSGHGLSGLPSYAWAPPVTTHRRRQCAVFEGGQPWTRLLRRCFKK